MKFKAPIEVQAGISDGDPTNPLGQSGYLLSSDGSNVNWVSPGNLSAATAEAVVQPIKANGALSKGDPVYIVGFQNGQNVNIVAKADSSDVAKMPVVGLADDDYANQAFGTMTAFGSFNGDFDTTGGTESWAVGDIIFVKPGGGLTNIKPGGTDLIQNVAIVSRVNSQTGELEVIALGRTNDVPNLPTGRLFVGTATNTSLISDVVYVDDANDRVGIGTTSPGANLEVAGTGLFTDQVTIPATPVAATDAASKAYVDSAPGGYTWTAAADVGSNRIIQDGNTIDFKGGTNINTENVGGETRFNLDENITILGTIVVAGSLGTSGIYGDSLLGTSSTDLVEILATLRLDGPVKDKTNTLGTAGKLLVSNSNGELNYSPRLLVDETNGRLSIFNATASTIPSGDNFTLDVRTEKGRLQVEGNDVDGLKLDFEDSAGNGTAAIENNGSQNEILKIRSHGTSGTLGEIRFETNSVEAVRIDENQRVGVGTISPGAMLDVVASAGTSRALDVQTNSGSLSITTSDTNGSKINFKFGTQSTTTASIENNGSENQFLVLRAQGTTSTDGNIKFVTNGTDAMRIDENQNVGIGVISPASKLEVDGGDIEIDDAASGLILRSPNGTRYRIKVDNSGNLSTTAV